MKNETITAWKEFEVGGYLFAILLDNENKRERWNLGLMVDEEYYEF